MEDIHNEGRTTGVDTDAVRALGSGLNFVSRAYILFGGIAGVFFLFSVLNLVLLFSGEIRADFQQMDVGLLKKMYLVLSLLFLGMSFFLTIAGVKAKAGRNASRVFQEDARMSDLNDMLRAVSQHFGYIRYIILTLVLTGIASFVISGILLSSMPYGG